MKRIALAAVGLAFAASALAVSGKRPLSPDLSVSESIVDLGGGVTQYTYTLTNVSAVAPVWWWGIYSNAGTVAGAGDLDFSHAGAATGDMTAAGYSDVVWTFNPGPSFSPNDVATGGHSVITFTGTALDTAPKLAFADVDNEWAGDGSLPFNADGTQQLSYLGLAPVPEPASLAALGLGALALFRRRRR